MLMPDNGIKEQRRGSDLIRLPRTKGPLPLVLLLSAAVFTGETLISALLHHLGIDDHLFEAVIDSTVLLALISPALYFFVYRPLHFQMLRFQTSEARVRQLSQSLLQASEEEQRRLALDLHDELGQSISALQLEMEALQAPLHAEAPQFVPHCKRLMQHLSGLHRQVRSIAGRLRPTLLDDLGIAAALEGMIADLKAAHPSIDFQLKITGLKRRPLPEVETALFRICQEGLSNALRHAHAQRIEVLLTASYPELILTVRDNGAGLQTGHGSRGYNDGLGLLGIRERATALNGKFYLQSTPGQGTRVRVVLPYGSVEDESDSRPDC